MALFSRAYCHPLDTTGPSSRVRAINKVTVAVISAMHDWKHSDASLGHTVGINYL